MQAEHAARLQHKPVSHGGEETHAFEENASEIGREIEALREVIHDELVFRDSSGRGPRRDSIPAKIPQGCGSMLAPSRPVKVKSRRVVEESLAEASAQPESSAHSVRDVRRYLSA